MSPRERATASIWRDIFQAKTAEETKESATYYPSEKRAPGQASGRILVEKQKCIVSQQVLLITPAPSNRKSSLSSRSSRKVDDCRCQAVSWRMSLRHEACRSLGPDLLLCGVETLMLRVKWYRRDAVPTFNGTARPWWRKYAKVQRHEKGSGCLKARSI